MALCRTVEASSVHVTFARKDEWELLAKNGFLQRTDKQFHWENQGYATFDDFLAAMNSRHRKQIKRERREAVANGITIEQLTGKDLTEAAFDAFFRFYMETGSRKWGSPYLTRDFYSRVAETMADDILLVMAKRNGRWIAGAINFIGSRDPVRPPLGRSRASPVPAFRGLLLSGHRLRHSARLAAGRSRRAGRAQAGARLHADRDVLGALHSRPGFRHAVADYLKRERQYVAARGR